MRRLILLASLYLPASGLLHGQQTSLFEFVESVPVETDLDDPEIRNTREVWLEMINRARKSLDIEQFYISNKAGEPLDDVLSAIVISSERGVRVRIIVDATMYRTYPQPVDSLGKRENISVRIIDFGKLTRKDGRAGGVQHAKYFIVDGEEIFLGSQNFDWRALKHIRELGLRVRHHETVRTFQEVFDLDWELAEKNDPSLIPRFLRKQTAAAPFLVVQGKEDTIRLTPTYSPKDILPDTSLWDERHIVSLIDGARKSVSIQFLSYSPVSRDGGRYEILDRAIRRAAGRGVAVRMIVSDWQKGTTAESHLKDLTRVANVSVKFSSIPEWSGRYIPYARVEHCKLIVADGSMFWLGTSNGEGSYFHLSRNLGMIVENRRMAEKLEKFFMRSWEGSHVEAIDFETEYLPRRRGGEEN
jgi:phosphatidylserine/phosphatidylglycerophosphate/cardiolipin synthase-like enzyme